MGRPFGQMSVIGRHRTHLLSKTRMLFRKSGNGYTLKKYVEFCMPWLEEMKTKPLRTSYKQMTSNWRTAEALNVLNSSRSSSTTDDQNESTNQPKNRSEPNDRNSIQKGNYICSFACGECHEDADRVVQSRNKANLPPTAEATVWLKGPLGLSNDLILRRTQNKQDAKQAEDKTKITVIILCRRLSS